MNFRVGSYLVIFWVMQVVAQVLFKWGSVTESRWFLGFLGGNLFGFFSIWLLMLVYKEIHPNVALGLAFGGAFLFAQMALALVFRSGITAMQWLGIIMMVIGIITLAVGKI